MRPMSIQTRRKNEHGNITCILAAYADNNFLLEMNPKLTKQHL